MTRREVLSKLNNVGRGMKNMRGIRRIDDSNVQTKHLALAHTCLHTRAGQVTVEFISAYLSGRLWVQETV